MIYLIALITYLFPAVTDPQALAVSIVSGQEGPEYNGSVLNEAKQRCEGIAACMELAGK